MGKSKTSLTGSSRLAEMLNKMNIHSYLDVILHLPKRYEFFYYTPKEEIRHLMNKQRVVLYGQLIGKPKSLHFAKINNTTFFFHDEFDNDHKVVAWNRSYLARNLKQDAFYTIAAAYSIDRHELNLLSIKEGRIENSEAILPLYSLPLDYPNHSFVKLVEKAFLNLSSPIQSFVPATFEAKYRLLPKLDALKKCHFPSSIEDIHNGQRVLKYEEALKFSLKTQLIRKTNKAQKIEGKGFVSQLEVEDFIQSLPYALTSSQKKAIQEGIKDMNQDALMYRLLQGDVGSGKTLVAAILMVANLTRGSQSALMAPTDTLAKQHYENLKSLFKGTPYKITLLTGKIDSNQKKMALEDIRDGTSDIIIGTHALFSKSVEYSKLGFVVIDEQHKFGVNQRNLLASKGEKADVLLMSATPIPRTLALSIYGDLDVSTLTEFPTKKKDIYTKIYRSNSKNVMKAINHSLEEGKRIYIVAPKIEDDPEKELSSAKHIFEIYNKLYPGFVTLMHGKLEEEEKEEAIEDFKSGKKPILVSTSLIEVGIDVKQADLMIIYEAQSFSLSSLHQLRGRIGRDGSKSICLLLYDGNEEEEIEKLHILETTLDGFQIAEADLKRRGPGDIAGLRQSGLPEFSFVNIIDDFRIFECARDDANYILEHAGNPEFKDCLEMAKSEISDVSLA